MMKLTKQEVEDVLEAIDIAVSELCIGENFPQSTALYERLTALMKKIDDTELRHNRPFIAPEALEAIKKACKQP